MSDTLYNLQLRHVVETEKLGSRDDVISYIKSKMKFNGASILPHEPVLFYYGEENDKNAIICVGLPEGVTKDGNNFYLIDTDNLKKVIDDEVDAREKADASLQDSISGLDDAIKAETDAREAADKELKDAIKDETERAKEAEETEAKAREEKDNELEKAIETEGDAREAADKELKDAITFTKDDLASVIEACGLIYNDKLESGRVSYVPDNKDEVIRDAKDVTEAIDLISKFATKVSEDLTLSVNETNSVALILEDNPKGNGQLLTADVKLSESGSISSKTADDDNIISIQKDGLYATVDLSYEPHTHVLTFIKSDKDHSDGVKKVFELGGHTVYEAENKSHTVEMTVTTDGDKGTISGDVVISTDSHNNLTVKNNALFVDNHSKSIVYDEDDTVTVYTKIKLLDAASEDNKKAIETEKERAEKAENVNADAITANKAAIESEVTRAKDAEKVNFEAIETNKKAIEDEANVARAAEKENADAISVINGNEATDGSIKKALADAKADSKEKADDALDKAREYTNEIADSIEVVKNEASDLQYILYVDKKKAGTIDIPKDQFLKEVSYNPKSKELTLEFVTKDNDGKKVIIGIGDLVDIYTAGYGIAETNNSFSVKLSGDTETKKYLTVDANGVTLNGVDNSIKTAVDAEAKIARDAEKANSDAITSEVKRAKAAEEANADNISTIMGTGVGSIKKALADAKEYADTAANDEKTRAKEAEKKNSDNIAILMGTGEGSVSKALADAKADSKEKADKALNDAKAYTDLETKRAKEAEDKILTDANADSKEKADDALGKAKHYTDDETTRATGVEKRLQDAITTLTGDSETAGSVAKAVADEAKIARAAEKANADSIAINKQAIEDEAKAARAAETTLQSKIETEATTARAAEKANGEAISNEVIRAKAAEDANATAIATEKQRAEKEENGIKTSVSANEIEISTVKGTVSNLTADIEGKSERLKAVEKAVADGTKELKDLGTKIAEKIEKDLSDNTTKIGQIETSLSTLDRNSVKSVTLVKDVDSDLHYTLNVDGTLYELNIPQDQFLDDVRYDSGAKTLRFVFNIGGSKQPIDVKIADLVDTYTAGNGLHVDDNAFTIQLQHTEPTVKYLEVTSDGLGVKGIDEAIANSVKAVSDNTYTKNEVDAKDDAVKNIANNNTLLINTLTARVATNEGNIKSNKEAIDTINGNEAKVGSIANSIATLKTSLESKIDTKADATTVNAELLKKANATDVYSKNETLTKTEIENMISASDVSGELSQKANLSDVYTRTSIDSMLSAYVKTSELNTALELKANQTEVAATYATKGELETAKGTLNGEIAKKLDIETASVTYATKNELSTVNGTIKEVKSDLKTEIDKKVNATEVYTKSDIEAKLGDYAKSESIQSQLNEKINTTEAASTYATKDSLKDYATVTYVDKADAAIDALAKANQTAIDNFNLTYNPATSELVYTDKSGKENKYKLYSGSLIKSGKFDEKSNSIVLTIETAGQSSDITIPVTDLLSDVVKDIEGNTQAINTINNALAKLSNQWDVTSTGTVTLTKSTVGTNDNLSADVRVSSSNKQGIQTKGDGLYVSNDLEDYTVAYGKEGTISGQTAISKLLNSSETLETKVDGYITSNNKEIENLKTQITSNKTEIEKLKTDVSSNTSKISILTDRVQTNATNITKNTTAIEKLTETVSSHTSDIATIKSNVATNTSSIKELGEKVTTNTTNIASLSTTVTTLSTTVSSHTSKIEKLEGDVTTLKSDVSSIKTDITNIKNDVKNNTTNISKLEGKVETIETKMTNLESKVNTLETTVNNKIASLETTVNSLETTVNNLKSTVETLEKELATKIEYVLKEKLTELMPISEEPNNIIERKSDGIYVGNVFDEGEF